MERDIVPKLLEKIQTEFREKFNKSEKIKALEAKVRDGTATYVGAQQYAVETGDILTKVFKKYITEDALPDGRMYYNIAQRILQPTLKENYDLITQVTKQVQENINKQAGLGLKAVVPDFNQERVDGLVNHLGHAETFEEVERTLDEPIKQHAMSVVSDTIEANAKFQYDAGLQPKIVREAEGKCCEWCSKLEGSFRYPDEVPAEVYRRHDRCRCTVNYVVGKKRQDVHHGNRGQKRRYVKNEYGNYEQRKEERKENSKKLEIAQKEDKEISRIKRIESTQKITEKDLSVMPMKKLRELAVETAEEYYKSGVSGISFGNHDVRVAAEKLAESGTRTSLKKDILSMQKKMQSINNSDIIRVEKTTLEAAPNCITEVINKKGGIDRNYYDDKGLQIKQISNNNHGKPKQHPFGKQGEHVHDYVYDKEGNLTGRPIRELTEKERKENGDIL